MSKDITFAQLVNPKTPEQIDHSIRQVFWIYLLMAFSVASSALSTLYVVQRTSIDEIGDIPGTGYTSLTGILDGLVGEFVILAIAILFFRWKRSVIAAALILLIAGWRVVNVINVYIATGGTAPRWSAILLNPLYLAAAVVGLLATYRWWRMRSTVRG